MKKQCVKTTCLAEVDKQAQERMETLTEQMKQVPDMHSEVMAGCKSSAVFS